MNPDRTKFLVLGAAKCGTTSLCTWLGQHPDVYVAPSKEPVFFEAEFERGMDYYWSTYYPTLGAERAIGEGRTYNLYLPFVPDRIAQAIPDARLVALLRDPVERAYSHWWHRTTRSQERRSFADAVAADLRRIESGESFEGAEGAARWREGLIPGSTATRHATYVEMGYYAVQLDRYRRLFPADRLQIHFFDDLVRDAGSVLRELWRFLGVEPEHPIAAGEIRNRARTAQRGSLEAWVADAARRVGAHRWVPAAVWKAASRVFPRRQIARPALAEPLRRELAAHFEPHDRALEALLGRPVPYRARLGDASAHG